MFGQNIPYLSSSAPDIVLYKRLIIHGYVDNFQGQGTPSVYVFLDFTTPNVIFFCILYFKYCDPEQGGQDNNISCVPQYIYSQSQCRCLQQPRMCRRLQGVLNPHLNS